MLDVSSRYFVGCTVQYRENGQLAKALIRQATEQQKITPGLLSCMPTAAGRNAPSRWLACSPTSASRNAQPPVYLQRQPPLGVELQDPEGPARVPHQVQRHRALPPSLPSLRRLVHHAHRHSGIGLMTPPPSTMAKPSSSTPPAPSFSTRPTSDTRTGSSASRRHRPNYRPPRGSTSQRRPPPLNKIEREASHQA